VIETALHLFQEALLLFGKWHPVPLRLGIDAV
jgi:hypothetical protein